MRWILELIVRYRTWVSLALILVASLFMISSPPAVQARTARLLTMSIFYPLQITFDQILRAKNIYAENRRLKTEVALLSAKVMQLGEQSAENGRLRGMLTFEQETPYDLLPVRVVARDASPVSRSVVISAGKNKGVRLFMPVVGERGITGKVVQVMPGLSLVQLVTDPLNRTSILARRSRAMSILETENGADFFAHFRKHEDLSPGDTIVTSGLGGIYPKGFMVGVVDKIIDEHDPLFKKAGIRLSVDLGRLEELFVVRLAPQWSAFRQELDSLKVGK